MREVEMEQEGGAGLATRKEGGHAGSESTGNDSGVKGDEHANDTSVAKGAPKDGVEPQDDGDREAETGQQRPREDPGRPMKVWKKKGQKRTTKRVICKFLYLILSPSPCPTMSFISNPSGSRSYYTQIDPTPSPYPSHDRNSPKMRSTSHPLQTLHIHHLHHPPIRIRRRTQCCPLSQ